MSFVCTEINKVKCSEVKREGGGEADTKEEKAPSLSISGRTDAID